LKFDFFGDNIKKLQAKSSPKYHHFFGLPKVAQKVAQSGHPGQVQVFDDDGSMASSMIS
jgi:hypothetical protein